MSQLERKKSPIKQRILQFVDSLGISKRDFYSKTGISRGTLENNAGITEDTITKIFATFKDVNPFWLITGEGEMINKIESRSNSANEHAEETKLKLSALQKECNEKGNRIIALLDENAALKRELEDYKLRNK